MELIPFRDVILVRKRKGFWNKIVRLFLKGEYSHSEFVIEKWLTFGTDISRPANIHTYGYNIGEADVFRLKTPLTKEQEDIITDYLQSSLQHKYDIFEAVCVGFNKKCRGRLNRFICISIILEAYEKAGVLPKGISTKYKDFTVFSQSPYFFQVK